MKVVFVNNFAHVTGGADQHCIGLMRALRERGHEVSLLATEDDANLEHEGAFVPCRVSHSTRDDLALAQQARAFTGALWNRDAANAMGSLLDETRPDVVHVHKLYPQLSVAPVVVAARRGYPIVQTLHDFELISASAIDVRGGIVDRDETRFRYRLLNGATFPIRRRVYVPRISIFISVSRFVARMYAARGIQSDVLQNFVAGEISTVTSGFASRRGIVFWGRLRPEKGVLDVVEMAQRLPEIPVTIVGSGILADRLRHAASRIPNLQVTGYVPDEELREIVRGARVVVIPSRCQDAGPLVPLESLAAATPVVAYANGGLAEYVVDTGGGLVVPADPTALATAAATLHDDADGWAAHSSRGFAAVVERHTPHAYAAQLEDIYMRALTGKTS